MNLTKLYLFSIINNSRYLTLITKHSILSVCRNFCKQMVFVINLFLAINLPLDAGTELSGWLANRLIYWLIGAFYVSCETFFNSLFCEVKGKLIRR